MGKCGGCGAWNTLEEHTETKGEAAAKATTAAKPVRLTEVDTRRGGEVRVRTGLGELDAVLGGGLVQGSLVLVGGDPGVGKSTLLLQALDRFARKGLPVLYVSGEESVEQVRLRAERLGVSGSELFLLSDTDWPRIEATIREHKPRVAVVDSVQTVSVGDVSGVPGSTSQVREVAHRAMVLAKSTDTAVLLVGHVTKSGELAGPKVLEHFVDTVLYFEGDDHSSLRALRATKNRFGPAGELGLFEMVDEGLREVPDASARLLEERVGAAAGTAVVAAMEGTRPLLAEVQALVGRPTPAIPARTCVGVDRSRVLLLIAVLGKLGLPLHDRDVFVNAAGGVRLLEPAADLAISAALWSSLHDRAVPADTLLFGEVGLVGEVRATSHAVRRLKEAERHGFRRVIVPHRVAADAPRSLDVVGVRTVREALEAIG
jgi:DNA repair protein RadA/Sms